jgi:hypothetical protein
MIDSILIKDKKYLSSPQAGKLVGYTTDYVGQLCRNKKVESQMIGRTWYVSEDSILKHKEVSAVNLTNGGRRTASQNGVARKTVVSNQYAIQNITEEVLVSVSKNPSPIISQIAAPVVVSKEPELVVAPFVTIPPIASPIQFTVSSFVPKTDKFNFLFSSQFLNKAGVLLSSALIVFGSYSFSQTSYAQKISALITDSVSIAFYSSSQIAGLFVSDMSSSVSDFSDSFDALSVSSGTLLVETGKVVAALTKDVGMILGNGVHMIASIGFSTADVFSGTGETILAVSSSLGSGVVDADHILADAGVQVANAFISTGTFAYSGFATANNSAFGVLSSVTERVTNITDSITTAVAGDILGFGNQVIAFVSGSRDLLQDASGKLAGMFTGTGDTAISLFASAGNNTFSFTENIFHGVSFGASTLYTAIGSLGSEVASLPITTGRSLIVGYESIGKTVLLGNAILEKQGIQIASAIIHSGRYASKVALNIIPNFLHENLSGATQTAGIYLADLFPQRSFAPPWREFLHGKSITKNVIEPKHISLQGNVFSSKLGGLKNAFLEVTGSFVLRAEEMLASTFVTVGDAITHYFSPSTYAKNDFVGSPIAVVPSKKETSSDATSSIIKESKIEKTSGVVVLPSSGNAWSDEEAKKKVKASFSDEVEVVPDKSGSSGIVRPIFKNKKGSDFIYVLVPINNEE